MCRSVESFEFFHIFFANIHSLRLCEAFMKLFTEHSVSVRHRIKNVVFSLTRTRTPRLNPVTSPQIGRKIGRWKDDRMEEMGGEEGLKRRGSCQNSKRKGGPLHKTDRKRTESQMG